MADQEPETSAEKRPPFPFAVLWPGYGNANVSLPELQQQADGYEALGSVAELPGYDVPLVLKSDVESIITSLDLGKEFVEPSYLICNFYVAPAQMAAFAINAKASRKVLLEAIKGARALEDALDRLSPKVMAALFWMRATVEGVRRPDGIAIHELHTEVADFVRVAKAAAQDLAASTGRPRHHHRDTMIGLLLELCHDMGLDDLTISNGTKAKPDPHLKGRSGDLILSLVQLVEPGWEESWIAQHVKLVRARLRNTAKTGAKTRVS